MDPHACRPAVQVVLARHRESGKEYALKVVDKQYIIRWVLGAAAHGKWVLAPAAAVLASCCKVAHACTPCATRPLAGVPCKRARKWPNGCALRRRKQGPV